MRTGKANTKSWLGPFAVGAILVAIASSRGSASDASISIDPADLALQAEHAVTKILSMSGDAAFGEYLGGECVTCHQQSGKASGIPPIAGLPTDYAVQALVEYRLGLRENDIMKLMTTRLSDEEIAALAAYFSTLETD